MIFTACKLNNAYMIDLDRKADERGFFARTYCRDEFAAHGLLPEFVQCNLSFNSRRSTLRGMHYQVRPNEEEKLVRCIPAAIYAVIIHLSPPSSTYNQCLRVD